MDNSVSRTLVVLKTWIIQPQGFATTIEFVAKNSFFESACEFFKKGWLLDYRKKTFSKVLVTDSFFLQ